MRYFRILLLYFEDTMTSWTRSLVWLLIPLINGGFFMLFWHAAFTSNRYVLPGWDSTTTMVYYLLLIIFSALINAHIEEKIELDIRQGDIVQYLLKPYPYFLAMFFSELPYRIIQGGFALLLYLSIAFFYPALWLQPLDVLRGILVFLIIVIAMILSQTFKVVLGLIAFWTKDNKGIADTVTVLIIFFTGMNLPIVFMPLWLQQIAFSLPFPYLIYFPIIGMQGKLSAAECLNVIGIQLAWLILFVALYKILLKQGLRKFTAVGQ